MESHQDKNNEQTKESIANGYSGQEERIEILPQMMNSQTQLGTPNAYQEMANNSPQVMQQQSYQKMANQHQRNKPAFSVTSPIQRQSQVIQRVENSGSLELTGDGTVSKAPSKIGVNRFKDSGNSIHKIAFADLSSTAGTIVEGDNDRGARIDMQGTFAKNQKTWLNIQVQANRGASESTSSATYPDLKYPDGTQKAQQGTSFAEVHVDENILDSEKGDVQNRVVRLLKQGLMSSRGERDTYPRNAKKITD